MAAYSPCSGSFQAAVNTRRANTAGLGSKFSHMHGKVYGHCAACGRTGLVIRADGTAPAHKAPVPVPVPTYADGTAKPLPECTCGAVFNTRQALLVHLDREEPWSRR